MADLREPILARLALILGQVEGVKGFERNALDVPGLYRPAILLHDGSEEFFDKPEQERRSRIQRMELTPGIVILAGAAPALAGPILSTYRARIVPAILGDAELAALVTRNGEIRYHGCDRPPPAPESKEGRLELHFVFTYILRLTDFG